jgi:pimeloyl-ACP methyl ester carboxylesterase
VTLGAVATRRLSVPGSGTPFLFLPGFADSADTWRPLITELADAGRPAAAIDLGGFATADDLDRSQPLLPQWDRMAGKAILELSAAHGGGEVFVVGNSLGGSLAMRAAEHPELPVAGIVPIAPAGLEMARWFPVIEGERLIRLLRYSPLPVPELVVRELVGRVYASLVFSTRDRADPEAIASFTRHISSVERGQAILDVGRRLLPELGAAPFKLERIDCPLLLIWGERDRMVFTGGAERVLRTVPYSDIAVIPACGHCPQVEAPQRLAEMLLDFPDGYEHP